MTKLSKEYESTVAYPVQYENLPKDKLLQKQPVDEIGIHVKATGFKILSGKLFPKKLRIRSSNLYLKSGTNYFLLLSQQRLSVQRQMRSGVVIDHFINDSIQFSLGQLKRKKLPIKLLSDFTYETGYDILGKIVLKPDSVYISGPEALIDTTRYVETTELVKQDINESFQQELALRNFSPTSIRLDTQKISVSATVEKFTEEKISVPFTVVNLPEDTVISTYPKEITITYKVSLSNFGKINPSSFSVECNYRLSRDNNLEYLVPKLTTRSKLVKNVKIAPNRIDFVIEK